MKQNLSSADHEHLDRLISDIEKRTNAQIVLAVIQRSDNYAEIPWKAFALGASLTGLMVFLLSLLSLDWDTQGTVIISIVAILGCGALLALLTTLIPKLARQFLSDSEADMEVRQYAESLFLNRELFATSSRTGILVLVSLFERKIVVIPDNGLSSRLTEDSTRGVIKAMTPFLKQGNVREAFEAGLKQLADSLGKTGQAISGNELPDDIIEEEGS